MSRLRAKCPFCRTLTAVALGPEYECHSCGRVFQAGLVRVPRAWGAHGERMAEAAWLSLPYPETGVVEAETLPEQNLALASDLPERPLVLGGCCSAHIGAVEGLSARYDRLAVVWIDAHGDLNTPETSPSGNPWGMALRSVLDGGAVEARDVALIGARNLDPPEEEFIERAGVRTGDDAVERALADCSCVYVALDADSLDPAEMTPFMPEPDGLTLDEVETLFARLKGQSTVVGVGLSGLAPDPENVPKLHRLTAALGL